jgi:aquaporin Z
MIKPIVEFIGTFIFFSVILSQGQAIPIGIALTTVIYFGGVISGGHYNPGVSLMMLINGKLPLIEFVQFILVQGLAAVAAVYFSKWAIAAIGPSAITKA